MLHREIPFLRICAPLASGIVSGLYIEPGIALVAAIVTIIIVLFLLSLRLRIGKDNYLFGVPVFMTLWLLGLLLYSNEKRSLSKLPGEPCILVCTLSDYPVTKPRTQMLKLQMHQKLVPGNPEKLEGSIVVYHKSSPGSEEYVPGDRLILRCTPSEITNKGNPYEFNYKFYMENLGVKYQAFTDAEDLIMHDKSCRRNILHKALIIRRRIIEMYGKRGISEERLPLVAALTLGEKSNLDPDQKDNFIRAGVMHIMAVSGLHAVILSMFIMYLLFFLKRRLNVLRILLAIVLLWGFAFVTGLTPSVLRATIMFTFFQAGNLMHRKANGINSVLASAFVLMLIRPSVIFDPGFLLSYAAVIFIIAFYRDLHLMLNPPNKPAEWLWQSIVVTTVAQAGTLPFTIMMFNRFPVWFLLTNIIVVPMSSLAVILGCLIPLLYPFQHVSLGLGFMLDKITWLLEFITAKAAELPFSGITGIGITTTGCCILFGMLFALMKYFTGKNRTGLHLSLSLLLVFVAYTSLNRIRTNTTNELIVYNIAGGRTMGIRTGEILNVWSDTLALDPVIDRHRSAAGLKVNLFADKGSLLVDANGRKVGFFGPDIEITPGIDPDILILSGFKNNMKRRLSHVPEKIIILDGSQVFTFSEQPMPPVYYIRKEGAYISKL